MSVVDPDELLRCPYDGNHRVRAARFPYHLVKCRKNNPHKARMLESCPFNARHCIPKADMKHHITNCSDKKAIEEDFVSVGQRKHCEIPQSTWQCPPSEEDWERDDGNDTSATFVYGYSNLNRSCVKGRFIFPSVRRICSPIDESQGFRDAELQQFLAVPCGEQKVEKKKKK